MKPQDMLELDRWAVTRLNALIQRCEAAYQNYEFHVVSHAVNDFCVSASINFWFASSWGTVSLTLASRLLPIFFSFRAASSAPFTASAPGAPQWCGSWT